MEEKDIRKTVEAAQAELQRRFKDDYLLFLNGLIIPSANGPTLFKRCMVSFQDETFQALAPSIHAVRDGDKPPKRRFWIERTKKSAKDSDLAATVLWLMAYSTRPILIQICAANQDQARIIEDRCVEIIHYNLWLDREIEVVQGMIRNRRNPRTIRTQVEATSSAGAAQGPTPDVLILNELVHVDKWTVMEAHMNNADGVPRGIAIVSTNAGVKGTPAHVWRMNAVKSKRWDVYIWDKKAPWVRQEDVDDARRRDPIGAEHARLWRGIWISGIGTAIDEETLERSFKLKGPQTKASIGWYYIAGLDLGVTRDHAGIAILGVNPKKQKIRVARVRGYKPNMPVPGGKTEVDLSLVEKDCLKAFKIFRICWFGYDPAAGGSFMAQRLRRKGVPMQEVTFSNSKNLTDMATAFVTCMEDEILECYEDREGRLRRDFGKFNIHHRPPSRYRLDAVSDEFGHADVGTALVICLPRAKQMLEARLTLTDDDVIADVADEELTDEEMEALPIELRGIIGVEEEVEEAYRESDGRGIGIPYRDIEGDVL